MGLTVLKDSRLPRVGDLIWMKISGWGGHSEFTFDSAGIYLGASKKHQNRVAFWLSESSIVIELESRWNTDVSNQLIMALSLTDVGKREAICWLDGLSHHLDGCSVRLISTDD